MPVIEPLVKGAIETLMQSGVKPENIVVENVSGSYELPAACSRCVQASLSVVWGYVWALLDSSLAF